MKNLGPLFDFGFHALITNLRSQEVAEECDCSSVGRIWPHSGVNDKGGRDHWPNTSMAIMAGGGLPQGIVIGATGPGR